MLLPACNSRSSNAGKNLVENSPSWGVEAVEEPAAPEEDSVVFLDYTPKASFTTVAAMVALYPQDREFVRGEVNEKFLKGCYYTGDASTPLRTSFAERWNRLTFLHRFVNAEELFERENSNLGDSLTSETVRGKMPMLPNEYQLAFRNIECRNQAKKLVKMLTTIDYVPEQTERMAQCFEELVGMPFETPDFLSEDEMESVGAKFWDLYDKSKYIEDYNDIRQKRLPEDVDAAELQRLSFPLQQRYIAETDFNARCIYVLEMGCYGFPDTVDYLGELIEDGRYSKYLYEVWVSWRLRAQASVFGISTFSEIPDNLYDNARLLVAKTFLNHLAANPSDTLAKVLLMDLTYADNIRRAGGYYGNEALGAETALRTKYFLPDELLND